ncbi:hypothetical protein C1H46_014360 [Malus baccata]|uniref:Presenilin n=1 Tax=Malus baccata TaxID=106549 RepID=A0A540MMK0_MALBA|nr:hypothetical protein C1H46_014360 [Malus baccata]
MAQNPRPTTVLESLGEELIRIITPVSVCMLLVVLLVTVLTDDASSSSETVTSIATIAYDETASDSSWDKFVGALLNSLVFVAVVTAVTFVLVLLFYLRCIRFLKIYMGFSSFVVLGFMGGEIALFLIQDFNVPVDSITFVLVLFNFAVVGVLAVFMSKMAIFVTQGYLVVIGMLVAYWFTLLPEWTTWVLLVAMALYDLAAVLLPVGPLRLLVELAISRDEEIPALVYEARPVTPHDSQGPVGERRVWRDRRNENSSIGNENPNSNSNLGEFGNVDNASSLVRAEEGRIPERDQELSAPLLERVANVQPCRQEDVAASESLLLEGIGLGSSGSIKLGLGDFIFYSVLVGRAAMYDFMTVYACYLAIIGGLGVTLILLAVYQKALPALPVSIMLGVLFYVLTRLLLEVFVVQWLDCDFEDPLESNICKVGRREDAVWIGALKEAGSPTFVAVDAKLRRLIFRPVRNHRRFSEGRKESDGFGLPEAEPRQFLVMESADDRTRLSPAATTPCEVDTAAKGSGSGSGRLGLSDQLNELKTDPITALGEANISTVGESLSNSQVSDCNEAFELGANATSAEDFAACAATDAAQNVQPSDRLEGSHSQPADDANDSATQSPPTQMMERPGDPASSPYRIPDYVFARNKSTAPLEWSTESNESLFSIQMGNTSFTRDQFNWLCKSGELGLPGEVNYLPGSPCNIDFTSNQPPAKQTAQSAENASNKLSTVVEEPSLRVTEEKAAETMREVLRENAVNHEREKSTTAREGGKHHSARLSHASDGMFTKVTLATAVSVASNQVLVVCKLFRLKDVCQLTLVSCVAYVTDWDKKLTKVDERPRVGTSCKLQGPNDAVHNTGTRGHKCFATGRRNETQAPIGVKANVAARIAAANAGRNTECVVSALKTNPNCTQVRLGAVLLLLLPIVLYLEKVLNIFSPWSCM